MAEVHARDYSDKRRIDDLRRAIDAFYKSSPPPRRASPGTLLALGEAAALLDEDSARIVRAWD